MNRIKLNDRLSFSIEREEKRLRLIVSDDNEELACHKISLNEFQSFLNAGAAHLFKGRLQLDKSGDAILVSVKSNKAGVVRVTDLEKLINLNPVTVL